MKKYGLIFFFASTITIIGSDRDTCGDCRAYIPGKTSFEGTMCQKHLYNYQLKQYENYRPNGCTCKQYHPDMFSISCQYHMKRHQQGLSDKPVRRNRLDDDDCVCM